MSDQTITVNTKEQDKLNEANMFNAWAKNLSLQETKDLMVEQITKAENWDRLSTAIYVGLKICAVNK